MERPKQTLEFIKSVFANKEFIPLHEPSFVGNEKDYLIECIDSTFVSSVGAFVDRFENELASYTGSEFAVATSNGTAALHVALLINKVTAQSLVITQPLTFVATANAIAYCGAQPLFVDVDPETLCLSPESLQAFLDKETRQSADGVIHTVTGKRISACLPVHVYGHPGRINEIIEICQNYRIPTIEDAAESIGSFLNGKHTGTFGSCGIFSFNGNKTITSGGGGALVTSDRAMATRAKHLTTTAKVSHPWHFIHDEIGYNYRMPNINAALACAQLENLESSIKKKRDLADKYDQFFSRLGIKFLKEPAGARSNYWLNTIVWDSRHERDYFLQLSTEHKIQSRPAWQLLHTLPMYKDCYVFESKNSQHFADCLVNIPSTPI